MYAGESENGFEYSAAPKEECEAFILHAFDNAVFQCEQALTSGRVQERILRDKGSKSEDIMKDYIKYMSEESLKFNDYIYEEDIE